MHHTLYALKELWLLLKSNDEGSVINQKNIDDFTCRNFTNKAVLEPRVSPDLAITYFCNHCNIRFENTDQSMWIH